MSLERIMDSLSESMGGLAENYRDLFKDLNRRERALLIVNPELHDQYWSHAEEIWSNIDRERDVYFLSSENFMPVDGDYTIIGLSEEESGVERLTDDYDAIELGGYEPKLKYWKKYLEEKGLETEKVEDLIF